jgi:hypothetical protein
MIILELLISTIFLIIWLYFKNKKEIK